MTATQERGAGGGAHADGRVLSDAVAKAAAKAADKALVNSWFITLKSYATTLLVHYMLYLRHWILVALLWAS